MSERWEKVPIPFWGAYYAVSTTGRICNIQNGNELKPSFGKGGYALVTLKKKPNKLCIAIHTLVLQAFVGPPPTLKHECCHFDGNRTNNQIENLRWGTRSENFLDKIRHRKSGRKFNAAQIREIKNLIECGMNAHAISKKFKVSAQTITNIIQGKSYFV